MAELTGWVATVVFALSYFFREQRQLLLMQSLAASLWIVYGTMIGALPVIISNIVIAVIALAALLKRRMEPS